MEFHVKDFRKCESNSEGIKINAALQWIYPNKILQIKYSSNFGANLINSSDFFDWISGPGSAGVRRKIRPPHNIRHQYWYWYWAQSPQIFGRFQAIPIFKTYNAILGKIFIKKEPKFTWTSLVKIFDCVIYDLWWNLHPTIGWPRGSVAIPSMMGLMVGND